MRYASAAKISNKIIIVSAALSFWAIYGLFIANEPGLIKKYHAEVFQSGYYTYIFFLFLFIFLLYFVRTKAKLFLYTSEVLWGYGFMSMSYSKWDGNPFNSGLFCAGIVLTLVGIRDFEELFRNRKSKSG